MMTTMKIQRVVAAACIVAIGVAASPRARAGDDASAVRMILELADGSHVRALAREVQNGIEVKSGGGWRLVEADTLLGMRRESDVLAEKRTRLDVIPLTHVGARVEACGWMIDQGLDQEAIDELDRILRFLPDEAHVLRLMSAKPPHLDLRVTASPAETLRVALIREGARTCNIGGSLIRRELVIRALRANEPVASTPRPEAAHVLPSKATDAAAAGNSAVNTTSSPSPSPNAVTNTAPRTISNAVANAAQSDPLRDALVTELGSTVIARRTFACVALRRLFPDGAIGPMAVHAVLDPAIDVRDEAILGLRAANDAKACGMLVQALANPSGLVRGNAIDAIGRAGYREGVEPLINLMIAASAAAASGGGGGGVRSNLFIGLQTTYVQDFNVQIAQGASIADPIIGALQTGVVFDVTVGGVSNIPITTEVWDAALALTRLTGERIGADPQAWEKWWKANRYRFVPGVSEHPTETRGG